MQNKKNNKLFISSGIYLISAVLYIIIRIGSNQKWFAFLGKSADYVVNGFNQIIIMALIPILLFSVFNRQKVKTTMSDFKFKKVSWHMVGLSFLLGAVMYFIVVIISSFWRKIVLLTGYKKAVFMFSASLTSPDTLLGLGLAIIFTCVLPAVCEEIIMRGCVLYGQEKVGSRKAILYSAILFALLHMNIMQTGYTFVMGIVLGLVTILTYSIWPAIIIHFTSNLFSVLFNFIYNTKLFGVGFNNILENFLSGQNIFTSILIISFVIFLLLFAFMVVISKIIKHSKARALSEKLKSIMSENALTVKEGEPIPLTEESGEMFIEMQKLVQTEIMTNRNVINMKPLDFILPKTDADKYKTTRFEWSFLVACFILTGAVTLFTLIWGII